MRSIIISTFVVAIAAMAVAYTAFRDNAHAIVTGNDTIVGIDPGGVTDPKRLAVRPEGWAQPVYAIWVTADCADTLNVGSNWPSAAAACQ